MKVTYSYRTRISIFAMLAVLVASHVQAQTPKIAAATFGVNLSEIQKFWEQTKTLLNKGEIADANLKLVDLNQAKLHVGFSNLSAHTEVLIRYAYDLKNKGRADDAVELLNSAQLLSPDVSAVYFALARCKLSQNFADVYGIGKALIQGVAKKYQDINTIVIQTNNLLASLLIGGSLTGAAFVVFSFLYYRRAMFYQLKTLFPFELPAIIANSIGWIVLGLITVICGVFWGLLFLALWLIWHLDPGAKRLLQFLLFFAALVPPGFMVLGITYSVFNGGYFQSLREIAFGEYTSQTAEALKTKLQTDPNDFHALFGLAYMAKNAGKFQDAIETYEAIDRQYPSRVVIKNNLGNLYQAMYRSTKDPNWYQKSVDAYMAAVQFAQKAFEPRYNFGQLLLQDFNKNTEAQDQIKFAQTVDRDKYTRYSGYIDLGIMTVDMSLSPLMLLQKLSTPESRATATTMAKNFWKSGSRFDNIWYFSIAAAVIFVLSFVFGAQKDPQEKTIHYCQMCGDPYTLKRKKKTEEQQNFCAQCGYIFKKKTSVKPEKREEKIKQIQLRQKLRGLIAKISSFCVPGAGQIYFGYVAKGVLLAFGFFLAIGVIVLKSYAHLLLDFSAGPGLSMPMLGILLLLIAGLYAFNIYDIYRLSPKNQ